MSKQESEPSPHVVSDAPATVVSPASAVPPSKLVGMQAHVRLLDSVAAFTHHRDIDALDHSLVLSLAELTSARSVSLAKRTPESHGAQLQSIVHCASDESGSYRVWVTEPEPGDPALVSLWRCMDRTEAQLPSAEDGAGLLVPIVCEGRVLGALQLDSDVPESSSRPLVDGFARIYANYTDLLNESERDKLTGLYNRRTFERHLQRLLHQVDAPAQSNASIERRSRRGPGQIWLAIMDIDHFKHINDRFGHVYGDEVILLLAQQMRACFRHDDVLFRFGGEEFVILLNADDEPTVRTALERFRRRVTTHVFPQAMHVSVSIGFASFGKSDYQQTVLDRADKALYFAKENGRDCTHGYESLAVRGLLGQAVPVGSIDLF
ncbi:MAG: GGDEF domain-containing protein [Rhodanobacter sp.]|nr:GGDEF domain-containing protein [Rhodanobacter sp.]